MVLGLGDDGTPDDWSLTQCAEHLRPQTNDADVIVGHDLGGVLCAMTALPGQSVILSGTALGIYWKAIQWTALPLVHRWFFQRHGGRHFLSKGGLPEHADTLMEAFGDHGIGWPDRMRKIALAMKPPPDLGQRLRACNVQLVWGTQDPWYPPVVARSVQKATGGQLHWLPCGHFAPWEAPQGFARVLTGLHHS
jgi:pimeloyl-ACP methyl ester carboxylesterase